MTSLQSGSVLRRFALLLLLLAGGPAASAEEPAESASGREVTVYKSPTCGCCSKWIDHLEASGFSVVAYDVPDVEPVKAQGGLPRSLASCHTAFVGDYLVEGHVPAADMIRLLSERPAVRGLAVPGMPIGSPGMEGPNPERYRVYSFDDAGGVEVFATHGPAAGRAPQ